MQSAQHAIPGLKVCLNCMHCVKKLPCKHPLVSLDFMPLVAAPSQSYCSVPKLHLPIKESLALNAKNCTVQDGARFFLSNFLDF